MENATGHVAFSFFCYSPYYVDLVDKKFGFWSMTREWLWAIKNKVTLKWAVDFFRHHS